MLTWDVLVSPYSSVAMLAVSSAAADVHKARGSYGGGGGGGRREQQRHRRS